MVTHRKLAVPYSTVFIAQLPEETKNIIREDLKQHAREHGYRLEWNSEARDYVGMTRRFCDIDDIYLHTHLQFCEPGEDVQAYEKSIQRNIILKLPGDDIEALCVKAGKVGLTVSELIENFVSDLVDGSRTNGSDERMHANNWFDRCWFHFETERTFLVYLLEWNLTKDAVDKWEELQEYSDQEELDEYDREEVQYLKEELKEMFQEYLNDNTHTVDTSIEEGMEKVMKWYHEKEALMNGKDVNEYKKDRKGV